MIEEKVAAEVAEAEFIRFADAMDIDISTKGMDDDDLKGFQRGKRHVLREIRRGRLVINEKGEPIFTISPDLTIRFRNPKGADIMAMDLKKEGHNVKKNVATLASVTGLDEGTYSKMDWPELKVCQALMSFFMD